MEGLRFEAGNPWRVLEFYSGIGGMRYALLKTGVDAVVVEAFDINDVANDVYEHNFGHRPHQGNIQTLTAADLDRYKANVWLLSPPCQPYTRQGHQKGSTDARSSSFLRILEVIPQCSLPPLMLFVENVVGFEKSDTHKKMIAMLHENHYDTQEFILSPLQFGVPYSRPRYFCLAKLKPLSFQCAHFNNELLHSLEPLHCWQEKILNARAKKNSDASNTVVKVTENCLPIRDFLELSNTRGDTGKENGEAGGHIDNYFNEYIVPPSLVERWGNAMDIVFPDSMRCCCFTKSYYRYVKGTGSFLATATENMNDESFSLQELRLRYFTPREVANIHSFPADFQFPEHVTLRQRYALLGNSLSVGVVAPLLRYLFSEGVV